MIRGPISHTLISVKSTEYIQLSKLVCNELVIMRLCNVFAGQRNQMIPKMYSSRLLFKSHD